MSDSVEALIARLPEGVKKAQRKTLEQLSRTIGTDGLFSLAGAASPGAGIVALTSRRLLFLYKGGVFGGVAVGEFAVDDISAAEADQAGLLVRTGDQLLRFSAMEPPEGAEAIAAALQARGARQSAAHTADDGPHRAALSILNAKTSR